MDHTRFDTMCQFHSVLRELFALQISREEVGILLIAGLVKEMNHVAQFQCAIYLFG